MTTRPKVPTPPPTRETTVDTKPSLGWRIRRWLRLKLYGDARKPYEPKTEWGKIRSESRERRRAWKRRAHVRRIEALVSLIDPDAEYRDMRFRREGEALLLEEKSAHFSSGWEILERFDDLDEARAYVAESETVARGERIALSAFESEEERPEFYA